MCVKKDWLYGNCVEKDKLLFYVMQEAQQK